MKTKYFIIIFLLLTIVAVMSFTKTVNQRFYYAYNEKIVLNEFENKLIVRYNQSKKSDKSKISLAAELDEKQFDWKDDSTCKITFSTSEAVRYKDKILRQTDVKSCNTLYFISTGLEMGVTDEIVLMFYDNVSEKEIDNMHKKYRVNVVKKNRFLLFDKITRRFRCFGDSKQISGKWIDPF